MEEHLEDREQPHERSGALCRQSRASPEAASGSGHGDGRRPGRSGPPAGGGRRAGRAAAADPRAAAPSRPRAPRPGPASRRSCQPDIVGVGRLERRRRRGGRACPRHVERLEVRQDHDQRPEVGRPGGGAPAGASSPRARGRGRGPRGGPVSRSNGRRASASRRSRQRSCAPGGGVLDREKRSAPASGATLCRGWSSTVSNRLRRAPWRAAKSAKAPRRAARSRAPLHPRRRRDVVGRALGRQSVEEPEGPLPVGQREGSGRLLRGRRPALLHPLLDGAQDSAAASAKVAPRSSSDTGRETPKTASTACWISTAASESRPRRGQRPVRRDLRPADAAGAGRRGAEPGSRPAAAALGRAASLSRSSPSCGVLLPGVAGHAPRRLTGEPARQPGRPAGAALHLAARRLGQRARLEQHHLVDLDLVLLGDGAADRRGDLLAPVASRAAARPPRRRPAAPRRPRSTAKAAPPPGRSAGWLALGRQLEVLRIVVAAADDDQVLEPAGDEQLAVRAGSPGRRCAGTARRRVGEARRRSRARVSSGRSQ